MAKDYSPERIATMRDELCDAARELGIPLTKTRAGELVTVLLGASARWSADTGTRAAGPFGTFLAGCAADADPSSRTDSAACTDLNDRGLSFVDDLVGGLSHETE